MSIALPALFIVYYGSLTVAALFGGCKVPADKLPDRMWNVSKYATVDYLARLCHNCSATECFVVIDTDKSFHSVRPINHPDFL